ncbi:MAG: hypothetical protein NC308_06365 [Clostridium sp.]|nr:hypothetical protein [Bacteroides sp.]MCM1198495.1 hypothetical protein [Clostridium sp.]
MKTAAYSIILFVFLCIGFAGGRMYDSRSTSRHACHVSVDTLVIYDTILHEIPVPVEIRMADTVMVAVRDTVVLHDTSFIVLPMEQRVYRDNTYMAVVSGYRPSLDTICIYPRMQCITSVHTVSKPIRKRWGIGIHTGYGICVHGGNVSPAPYIGVGLSYNLIQF